MEYGSPLERLAGDVTDCTIVLNQGADLPIGASLEVEVSDEKVEPYRVADVTLSAAQCPERSMSRCRTAMCAIRNMTRASIGAAKQWAADPRR